MLQKIKRLSERRWTSEMSASTHHTCLVHEIHTKKKKNKVKTRIVAASLLDIYECKFHGIVSTN